MLDARRLIQHYCRNHDQAAFRAFYDQEAPRLWQFLLARGASEAAAYDHVNESFLRFVQVACNDTSAPRALLYRIAVNLQIDAYRRASIRDEVLFDDDIADPATADNEPTAIRQLVEKLPSSEQNLVLMRYWLGLTHREIAEITGLPQGTVQREVATILKKLRKLCS